ncbi:hypothetical protein [Chitinimonas lacunae]|uniref:DUF2497 domain-containing protein n=1 Tax=Chitinimonas lacunae TaxID=1963018 RepID=A0ABV8MVZ0_9NEIS
MADQPKPLDPADLDSGLPPLLGKMDALIARHRGSGPNQTIPTLTEIAPITRTGDIPILTDVAPTHGDDLMFTPEEIRPDSFDSTPTPPAPAPAPAATGSAQPAQAPAPRPSPAPTTLADFDLPTFEFAVPPPPAPPPQLNEPVLDNLSNLSMPELMFDFEAEPVEEAPPVPAPQAAPAPRVAPAPIPQAAPAPQPAPAPAPIPQAVPTPQAAPLAPQVATHLATEPEFSENKATLGELTIELPEVDLRLAAEAAPVISDSDYVDSSPEVELTLSLDAGEPPAPQVIDLAHKTHYATHADLTISLPEAPRGVRPFVERRPAVPLDTAPDAELPPVSLTPPPLRAANPALVTPPAVTAPPPPAPAPTVVLPTAAPAVAAPTREALAPPPRPAVVPPPALTPAAPPPALKTVAPAPLLEPAVPAAPLIDSAALCAQLAAALRPELERMVRSELSRQVATLHTEAVRRSLAHLQPALQKLVEEKVNEALNELGLHDHTTP